MTRMSGAEATVRVLESQGVQHVFGLCGHTTIAVLDALEESTIRFVAVHHEQMAAHAAEALARRTGRAGVVLTHLGPGLTNAITGIANAMLDAVPMVVISGNIQSYFFGRHAHMEVNSHRDANQADGVQTYCKRVYQVDRPESLITALMAAFRHAETGRKGPVLVDVAMDVFSDLVDFERKDPTPGLEPSGLSPATARRVLEMVRSSDRPVLHLGAAVARPEAAQLARELAERLNLPVAYELLGKGTVPDDHPLVVGMTGFWGTPAANAACREADTLLSIGTKFGELDTSSWVPRESFAIPPTRLIHIHPDADEVGRSYRPTLGSVADPATALEQLVALLTDSDTVRTQLPLHLAQARDEFETSLAEARASDAIPMKPERVLADLRSVLDDDTVLVGDTGWNKNGVGQQYPMRRPDTFLPPGGYATMGFGPAAALGATLDGSGARVVALTGDGAFFANLSVVLTAVQESLPVVWVVMNNGSYATITGLQRNTFGSDYGTLLNTPSLDLTAFARSLGAEGVRVERAEDLTGLLKDALRRRVPFVLDVPTTDDNVPTTGAWDINGLFRRGLEAVRSDGDGQGAV